MSENDETILWHITALPAKYYEGRHHNLLAHNFEVHNIFRVDFQRKYIYFQLISFARRT